jgi:hypothetical protein
MFRFSRQTASLDSFRRIRHNATSFIKRIVLSICNRVEARLSIVTLPRARKLKEDERKGQAAEAGVMFRNHSGWLSGLNP